MDEKKEPRKTLRDEFAMAALAGMLADPKVLANKETAQAAYRMADYMLKTREAE